MDAENLKISTTTDGKPARPGFENGPAPAPIDPKTGQHEAYWVLNEEERKKGFVRPVRRSYRHVGARPKYPLRACTEEEKLKHRADFYETYPPSESPVVGCYWTKERLESGCGAVTTMGRALAETYARDPHYYGATMCCHCGEHFRVGVYGEFVWDGTDERVGT